MKSYIELHRKEPELVECFFAFSNAQFEEGVKKAGIEGKKIYRGIGGLFGTKEGIDQFMGFYDRQHDEIAKECDPQEVYEYEFINHECEYTGTDDEALEIVIGYFGAERAKEVKRKYAYSTIEQMVEHMKESSRG